MGPKQSAMTTPDLSKPEARSSSQIEADIRTTRARIDSTLEQLGARLNARSLLNSALDWWEARSGGPAKSPAGAATKQAYGSLARHLKENPVAALMVGAGLGWMIIETATSSSTASEPEKASAPPGSPSKSSLLESAKEAAGELGQRAQQVYQEGRSSARKLGGRRLESGYRAGSEQLENALEQYPLALGVGFAALGALIGVLLPPTRGEDQLLGESADQLLSATKDKGQQLLNRGKTLTQRVAQSALEQAREEGLTPAAASQSLSQIAGKVTQVARKAKEEAASAAKEEKLNPEQPKRESSSRSNTKKKSKEPRPS